MRILLFISALLCNLNLCLGQTPELKKEIEIIVGGKDLKLGFALYDFSTGKSISINGNDRYPMQSVFKFPIGVALLDCVSRGEFALSDSVTLTKADLLPDLWSPIRERWPEGVRLPLVSVMTYMVAHSDNSATDFLIHKIGGVARIQDIVNRLGAKKINIRNTEFRNDNKPIDSACGCYACRNFSRGFIAHLVHAGEMLGVQLGTIHNLHFYQQLMKTIRSQIAAGTYCQFAAGYLGRRREQGANDKPGAEPAGAEAGLT